jgi:UDP-N-acetylglucosamine enolpyruvyl transferase
VTQSRRIIIELDTVRASDVAVLRETGADAVVVTGNRIELELPSAGATSADLVAALVAGGARVNTVSTAEESLEDAYLTILGDLG